MLHELFSKHNAQFFVQYASSRDANFYYATRFKIPDPAFHIAGSDTDVLIVHEMEKERAKRESRVKEVISLTDLGFYENLKEFKNTKKALAHTYVEFLKSRGAKKVLIPHSFPSFLSFYFKEHLEVEIVENPFSKIRAVKQKDEIEKIKETSLAIIDAFNYLLSLLRKRKKMTCEELRNELELYLFSKGYLAEDTIIASGKLTADPHFIGSGEVEDHLIVDIFPRSRTHGYYSDFTRTVIIGENREIDEMLKAVIEAKDKAISIIKEGVTAKEVHYTACDVLESYGYHTLRSKYREGFIHSTGHGVGLEIHEEPRIYENDDVLKSGMVFTVEPGLYYRKWGGVRVEDTVVVTKHGCEILTPYPGRVELNG
jgi:Xaa-Pro aminopeptidase